ncbi:MAG: hypothetical protein ACP5D9_15080 [Mariniphaga sp.]
MKTIFCIFFFSMLFSQLNAQIVTKSNLNVTGIPKFNKNTGEKISNEEFLEIIHQTPNVYSEPKIDKFGEVEALFIDPTKSGKINNRDTSLRVTPGEEFPPFVMKTMVGQKLNSEKMRGKYILVYSELFLKPPFFNENAFNKTVRLINNFREGEIEMILLTERQESEIDKELIPSLNSLKIVPNARNFITRYIITEYPSWILVDNQGKLVSYYGAMEFQKLEEDLEQVISSAP